MHRKLIALAAIGASVFAAALPASAGARARTVKVVDNAFSPGKLSVKRGTVLRFRWLGDAPHNVVPNKHAFKRIGVKRSGRVDRKLRKRGRFTIRCTIHPGMSMRLRVR